MFTAGALAVISSVMSWMLKHWYVPVISVLAIVGWIGWKMYQHDRHLLDIAKDNVKVEQVLKKADAISAKIVQEEQKKEKERENARRETSSEVQALPGSNDVAGPFFDGLSKRLHGY